MYVSVIVLQYTVYEVILVCLNTYNHLDLKPLCLSNKDALFDKLIIRKCLLKSQRLCWTCNAICLEKDRDENYVIVGTWIINWQRTQSCIVV